jgi:hypothetical protein
MIKNYLYTIGLYLPPHQRVEILRDIEASLYEILEKHYGEKEYSQQEFEKVIIDFGHPQQVAQNYLGESLTLISSDLYNEYFLALKIALFGGNIGLLIANFIRIDVNTVDFILLFSFIGEMIQTSLSIFGLVTLIFILVNKTVIKEKVVRETTWSVSSLKVLVEEYAKVNRFDLGIESIFLIILSVGLFNNLSLLSNTLNQSSVIVFSLFIFGSLSLNLYLVIKGQWQFLTRIFSILLNLIFAYYVIQFYLTIGLLNIPLLDIKGVLISIRITVLFILIAIIYDCLIHFRRLIKK